jgi:hypothetical protein
MLFQRWAITGRKQMQQISEVIIAIVRDGPTVISRMHSDHFLIESKMVATLTLADLNLSKNSASTASLFCLSSVV